MLEFFTITLVILLGVISPGPDFAIVTRNSLRHSQNAGIMTALGIASGTFIHASYCILGFAIIISKSLLLFNIIKYIGAFYLIYLGIKGLVEKQDSAEISSEGKTKVQHIPLSQAFFQGLLCNLLNPKAIFFFLALFTMLITPSMPLILQAMYGLEMSLMPLLWFSAIAILFSHPKVKIFLGKFLHYITRAFGGVLIIFGLKVATLTQQ